jgi:hypothetical protein
MYSEHRVAMTITTAIGNPAVLNRIFRRKSLDCCEPAACAVRSYLTIACLLTLN